MSRVTDPADPRRCKYTFPHEQCWNAAEYGSDKCAAHGGRQEAEDHAHRIYLLTEVRSRDRLVQLTEYDQVHAMNEIIAAARVLVEKRFNLIRTDADFYEACGPINTLQLTVERISKSAYNIKRNLDLLLSKSTVFKLGELVIQISTDELVGIEDYDETIGHITQDIIVAIAKTSNGGGEVPASNLPSMVRKISEDQSKPMLLIENRDDQLRIAQLTRHERLISLNEDIAMAALMFEKRWNLIKNDTDLIQAVPMLNTQLRTLEKLIKSAHDIEQSLGFLLSEDSLRRLGSRISDILVERLQHIPGYENYVDRIFDRIRLTLANPRDEHSELPPPPVKAIEHNPEARTLGPPPTDDSDSAEYEESEE